MPTLSDDEARALYDALGPTGLMSDVLRLVCGWALGRPLSGTETVRDTIRDAREALRQRITEEQE